MKLHVATVWLGVSMSLGGCGYTASKNLANGPATAPAVTATASRASEVATSMTVLDYEPQITLQALSAVDGADGAFVGAPRVVQYRRGAPYGMLEAIELGADGHVYTNVLFRDGSYAGSGGWRGWAPVPGDF